MCDLNGRRLRHVNNDIKLQKWAEARERKEEAKRRGIELDSTMKNCNGVRERNGGWHLSAELIEHEATRNQDNATQNGLKTALAGRGRGCRGGRRCDTHSAWISTMVDGVRSLRHRGWGHICALHGHAEEPSSDWSTVLKVGDRMDIKGSKTQGRNKWYGYKAVRISADDHGSVPAFRLRRRCLPPPPPPPPPPPTPPPIDQYRRLPHIP